MNITTHDETTACALLMSGKDHSYCLKTPPHPPVTFLVIAAQKKAACTAVTLFIYKHLYGCINNLFAACVCTAGICMAAWSCPYLGGVSRSLIHLTFWLICMCCPPPQLRDAVTFIT